MVELKGARCAGMSWLFDSTDRADHLQARGYCHVCPVVAACETALDQARGDRYASNPSGTWAGRLYSTTGRLVEVDLCGTERGYYQHRHRGEEGCAPCKNAHAEAQRGADHHRRKVAS